MLLKSISGPNIQFLHSWMTPLISTVRNIKCVTILSYWSFSYFGDNQVPKTSIKWFVTLDFSTVYVFNIDSSLHLRLEQLSGRLWVWLFHWDFKLKHKNFVTRSPSLSKRSQTGPLKYIDNKNHGRSAFHNTTGQFYYQLLKGNNLVVCRVGRGCSSLLYPARSFLRWTHSSVW